MSISGFFRKAVASGASVVTSAMSAITPATAAVPVSTAAALAFSAPQASATTVLDFDTLGTPGFFSSVGTVIEEDGARLSSLNGENIGIVGPGTFASNGTSSVYVDSNNPGFGFMLEMIDGSDFSFNGFSVDLIFSENESIFVTPTTIEIHGMGTDNVLRSQSFVTDIDFGMQDFITSSDFNSLQYVYWEAPGFPNTPHFDNLLLDAPVPGDPGDPDDPVPEEETIVILGLGLGALVLRSRFSGQDNSTGSSFDNSPGNSMS